MCIICTCHCSGQVPVLLGFFLRKPSQPRVKKSIKWAMRSAGGATKTEGDECWLGGDGMWYVGGTIAGAMAIDNNER